MIDKQRMAGALLALIAVLALSACGTTESAGTSQPALPGGSTSTEADTGAQSGATEATPPDGATAPTFPPAEAIVHEVTLVGRDHAFEAPEEAPAGLITFTFRNEGSAVHHAQVVRLNEGVTFEELMAAFQEGESAAFPLFTPVGGPALTDPGDAGRVTLHLDPGAYALLCFVEDEAGIPHLAQGMARPLTITGEAAPEAKPRVDLTVSMADFQYTMPDEVDAGPQTWEVTNNGPQPHELVVQKLAPGKSPEDVIAFFHNPQGPPPFTNFGGMQALSPDEAGWLHLDLEPGTYVAICYVPDPASGKGHMDLGMVKTFRVSG